MNIVEKWDSITAYKETWRYKIKAWIISKCYNIRNFLYYGWKCRHIRTWDYCYGLDIFNIFVQDMLRDWRKEYPCHTTYKKDLDKLIQFSVLLNRVCGNDHDYYYEKANPYYSKELDELREERYKKLFEGDVLQKHSRLESKYYKYVHTMEERDWEYFCKLFKTQYRKFWY